MFSFLIKINWTPNVFNKNETSYSTLCVFKFMDSLKTYTDLKELKLPEMVCHNG